MKKNKFGVRDIVVVGLMAALVFAATAVIKFDIPTPTGKTMIHMGNLMCVVSGLLFGRVRGGLAAGIGSMFYDLIDPIFITQSWITFILKFLLAFAAGAIANGKGIGNPKPFRVVIASVSGSLLYSCLYISKQIIEKYYIAKIEWPTVWLGLLTKIPVTLINAAIASVGASLLYFALKPALRKAGLFQDIN